jgi:two-component system, NarL family, response regulator YdfI
VIRTLIVTASEQDTLDLIDLVSEDERIEVVGTAASPDRLSGHDDMHADVALVSAVPVSRLSSLKIPTVLLTDKAYDSKDYRGWVRARLPNNATPAEVVAALLAVAHGFTVLTPSQARKALDIASAPDDMAEVVESLTHRELEVLRMMARGSSNKEIADELGISNHTVKFHVASILGKLQSSTRTEAVSIGIRRGLVPI